MKQQMRFEPRALMLAAGISASPQVLLVAAPPPPAFDRTALRALRKAQLASDRTRWPIR
jgi:hypothetical protein